MIVDAEETEQTLVDPELAMFRKELAAERARDRKRASDLLDACRGNDIEAFYQAVDYLNDWTIDGWLLAFRKIGKLDRVAPAIQRAFFRVWVESKSVRLRIGNDLVTIEGLRRLLPAYSGPDRRLFRGERFLGRRRIYGMSWTTDITVAERFAKERQMHDGGSVVLEAFAPAVAIIARTHAVGDHYKEKEYLVDRRLLKGVKVIRKFAQSS